ncbi:MAG TPA: hypothetical protein VGE05_03245 [Novosphingobium sp.]
MQPDNVALIQRLCVIAGTIMEDSSLDALSTVSQDPDKRRERLQHLVLAGADVAALFGAAAILDRRLRDRE